MPKYSVVVPVYNSEKTLQELYSRVCKVFDENLQYEFELILVDDSSKDNSFRIMEQLHKSDERVKLIQLSKNYGQHCATLCGMNYASGDYVITIDDDLQHPPEEIVKLIDYMNCHNNVDVVIGKYDSKKHDWLRNLGSRVINKITNAIQKCPSDLELTSFRLIKINIVQMILNIHVCSPRIGYLLLDVTNNIANVSVHHDERKYGKSQYSLRRLISDFFNNIFNNSVFPLVLLRDIGFTSFLVSIILAIFYLIRYFTRGISIQGWTTIVLLILLFAGLILFGLGIVGEYLLRILNETKKLENYNIRRKIF